MSHSFLGEMHLLIGSALNPVSSFKPLSGVMSNSRLIIQALRKLLSAKPSPIILRNLELLAHRMGIDERELMKIYVDMKNSLHKNDFIKVAYNKRALLLPQCLRNRECKAEMTAFGYKCTNCGKCRIHEVKKLAESLGYKVFILPGGSMVEKIINAYKPSAVIGVACLRELVLGSMLCEKKGIPTQGIPLIKDGCFETEVDWKLVKRTLLLGKESLKGYSSSSGDNNSYEKS
ncbi:DUF116 domain-containing protein [Candidatus Geothermarchaeota archaeon]|nr:MAG: DUF116 domain-containing protein [Candidatus Geothermarchaeota archaeon]